MNYYEHHLGDYARDAGHLTMMEHGAYRLLLDRYYATEQGIPADQAHRVARARTREEKQAVDAILGEFFTLTDGVYINQRAEEEITKARIKIKAAQENGKRGGRPKGNPVGSKIRTQEEPSGFPLGSISETQTKAHQTPDTKHQTPEKHTSTTSTEAARENAESARFTSTPLGEVGKAMRRAGLQTLNLDHPKLKALIDQGVTVGEFESAARDAVEKGKGFAYALAVAEGRRRDVSTTPLPSGRGPPVASREASRAAAARSIFGEVTDGESGSGGGRERDITGEAVRIA